MQQGNNIDMDQALVGSMASDPDLKDNMTDAEKLAVFSRAAKKVGINNVTYAGSMTGNEFATRLRGLTNLAQQQKAISGQGQPQQFQFQSGQPQQIQPPQFQFQPVNTNTGGDDDSSATEVDLFAPAEGFTTTKKKRKQKKKGGLVSNPQIDITPGGQISGSTTQEEPLDINQYLSEDAPMKKVETPKGYKFSDRAIQSINLINFGSDDVYARFHDIYGTQSFLNGISLANIKYNFSFGVPIKDGGQINAAMVTYYEYAKTGIQNLRKTNQVNFYTLEGSGVNYTLFKNCYDSIVAITKNALNSALQFLMNNHWNGENIGSYATGFPQRIREAFKNATPIQALAASFLFPLARAITHLHNSLKKTIEGILGLTYLKAERVAPQLTPEQQQKRLNALTGRSTDMNKLIRNAKGEQGARKEYISQSDPQDLTALGVMISTKLMTDILNMTVIPSEDPEKVIRLSGSIGILHAIKNNIVGLYDSIRVFSETKALSGSAGPKHFYENFMCGSIPKAQKLPIKKYKPSTWLKPLKSMYETLCTISRHIFIGSNNVYLPSNTIRITMKSIILIKKTKSTESKYVKVAGNDVEVNPNKFDKEEFCKTTPALLAIPPFAS